MMHGPQPVPGPNPDWAPTQPGGGCLSGLWPIWAHMDHYGPIWAHAGPPGQVLAGADMSDFRRLVEFCMCGFKIKFLTKFLNDSARFLPEKLKNMFFQPKALIFDQKSQIFDDDDDVCQCVVGGYTNCFVSRIHVKVSKRNHGGPFHPQLIQIARDDFW